MPWPSQAAISTDSRELRAGAEAGVPWGTSPANFRGVCLGREQATLQALPSLHRVFLLGGRAETPPSKLHFPPSCRECFCGGKTSRDSERVNAPRAEMSPAPRGPDSVPQILTTLPRASPLHPHCSPYTTFACPGGAGMGSSWGNTNIINHYTY